MQHLRALPAARTAPMAAPSSLEAVKRKIQCLQQQADEAEDRAQVLQRELDLERDLREKVRPPGLCLLASLGRSLPGCLLLPSCLWLSLRWGVSWLSPPAPFLSCPLAAPLRSSPRKAAMLPHRLARAVLRGHRPRPGRRLLAALGALPCGKGSDGQRGAVGS